MTVLVLAETSAGKITLSTRCAITAALRLGNVHVLVAGEGNTSAVEAAARLSGVEKVLRAESSQHGFRLAEPLALLLNALSEDYSHVIAAASAYGKNVMPRLAALLDVQIVSDVIAIEDADTFVRPLYAGNLLATVRSSDSKKVLTIRAISFDPVNDTHVSVPIEIVSAAESPAVSTFVGGKTAISDRPELTSARIVVAGGRGVGSIEKFQVLAELADRLGAALGATRAAVDAGYAPNNLQIGQTGKIVAPELYIAVGISGAAQHLAGMKDSKVIVAINNDEAAPIFQVADYALVADLFKVLPEIEQELSKICNESRTTKTDNLSLL